jgi:hypothetical protein
MASSYHFFWRAVKRPAPLIIARGAMIALQERNFQKNDLKTGA